MLNQVNLTITKISRNNVVIHFCSSPDNGERVNAQIVETKNKLVIVDTLLLRPYAKEFRQYADSLGKPIDRVFITHAHPDHWFGSEFFQDIDCYALPQTIEEMKFMAPIALGFHRGREGDLVTDRPYFPGQTVGSGDLVIDDVTFRLHEILSAEDLFMLAIDLPDEKTLIAQDLVYNKVHLFVGQRSQDGTFCFDGWISALNKFDKVGYEVVLPGHGVPTDASIFQENIRDIEIMRGIVASSTGENFVQNTLNAFPGYGLRSMVEMSAFFLFPPK